MIDTVLRPGDALYLPRGWLHSAEALGETTIHLTIGMHATTRYDLVQALVALAADSPALRESLPIGAATADPAELQSELDLTVKALIDRLATATGSDAANAVRRRADRTTRPEPLGPLAQLDAINALDRRQPDPPAQPRPGPARGRTATQQVRLRTSVGAVSLPASARSALVTLLDGAVHRVGDLALADGADGSEDALAWARQLLTRGTRRTGLRCRWERAAAPDSLAPMSEQTVTTAHLLNAPVSEVDPEVDAAMKQELHRQQSTLEMIASENFTPVAVMQAQGSVLTNKYAEGYPGRRYYGGCEYVDVVEQLAIDRVKALFGAGFANVQPHSGASANTAVYFALLQPGDTILGLDLAHGGHLTHGMRINYSGKMLNVVAYHVNKDDYLVDMDEVRVPRP